MVRLDKCVEALYDSVTADTRNKNLSILTVMKGAISMSRSKTGECIFRTNKTERKNLERLIRIEGRHASYSIAQIETQRKSVINRWSKVLENQTSCSAEVLFEELMDINDGNDMNHEISLHRESPTHSESPEPKDVKLKTLLDIRLAKLENENNNSGFETVMADRKRHSRYNLERKAADDLASADSDTEFVTERKDIRNKYSGDDVVKLEPPTKDGDGKTVHRIGLTKSRTVHLPSVRRHNTEVVSKSDDTPAPALERDMTDWGNWSLKDKSWINGYLRRERTRHADLIIRNALNKIETDMSGTHKIRRQQMRQKLQNEKQQRETEIRRKERAQKEAEISREIALLSSGSGKSTPEKAKVAIKTVPVVKRVVFQEPLNATGNQEGHDPLTVCGNSVRQKTNFNVHKTNKCKKRYKPLANTFNHLPVIQEGSRLVKVTST